MSGLVGVISNDFARSSLFWNCMMNLRMTEEARLEQLIGGDWCGARNTLAQMTLDGGYDWLWFMDDDHAFSPDLLNRLLRHDLPLVVPVCLTRVPPFKPVTFVERLPDQEFQYLPAHLPNYEDDGVIELAAGGCAGMLIRREVLEAIEPPWFEYKDRSEDIIFCLPPGAWVDGDEARRIEDVEVGDYVRTHSGSLKRVRDTSERVFDGEMTVIRPTYEDDFRLTPNHRLLVRRGQRKIWIAAGEVIPGDQLCIPKPSLFGVAPEQWVVSDLVDGLVREGELVGYARTRKSALRIADRIYPTPSFGRLLGYFLADGTFGRDTQQAIFNIGAHKTESVEDVLSLMQDLFDYNPVVDEQKGCARIRVTSAVFSRFLASIFDGKKSLDKRLPSGWRTFDRATLTELIKGYWRSDGSYSQRNGFRATTASPRLAADLRSALLSLGIYTGVRYRTNSTAGRFDITVPRPHHKRFADLLGIEIESAKQESYLLQEDDSYYFINVASVRSEPFEGKVYNLSVEEDESYTANGFAVHNCEKAKDAGFSIFCDLSARLGHITMAVVWPTVRDDRWVTGFTIGRDLTLFTDIEETVTV